MNADLYAFLAIDGEAKRGAPGCVWVDSKEQRAKYVLTTEIPVEMRQRVEETIEEDENTNFFILCKAEDNVHILSYPRKEAFAKLANGGVQRAIEEVHSCDV